MAFVSKLKRAILPTPFSTSRDASTVIQGNGPTQRTNQPRPGTHFSTSSAGPDVGARPPGLGSIAAGSAFKSTREDGQSTTTAVQPRKPQTINVILFGETGVGKSAIVNLIARKDVAEVSSDVVGCTMQSTRYDIPIDGMNFSIFDTIGLNGAATFDRDSHLEAVEGAYKLILELKSAGGVHLLLFCMRRGRISLSARNNYRLFSEFLCQSKVPVAIVVTGLEYYEEEMEGWWTKNETATKACLSIKTKDVGHACVTTVTDGPGTLTGRRYTESQQKIRDLLKKHPLKSGAVLSDALTWLALMGRGMKSITNEGRKPLRQKDIERILLRRLKLQRADVKKIIDLMEKGDTSTNNGEH